MARLNRWRIAFVSDIYEYSKPSYTSLCLRISTKAHMTCAMYLDILGLDRVLETVLSSKNYINKNHVNHSMTIRETILLLTL